MSDVDPNSWCFGDVVENVTIQGSGFTEDIVAGSEACEFSISSGEQFSEWAAVCMRGCGCVL